MKFIGLKGPHMHTNMFPSAIIIAVTLSWIVWKIYIFTGYNSNRQANPHKAEPYPAIYTTTTCPAVLLEICSYDSSPNCVFFLCIIIEILSCTEPGLPDPVHR